jgi:glycosyltransferase involved in cell wall biosynthesis
MSTGTSAGTWAWRLSFLPRTRGAAATARVLLISSFVRPHPGGVEEFIDSSRALLEERGLQTRVLACRLPGMDTSADAVIPTRFVGRSSWPLPIGGWRTLWREVSASDAVVANNARHLLPVVAVLLSRVRGRVAFLVVHGSGAGPYGGSLAFRLVRSFFERTLGRLAMRVSRPVSVSQAGVEGVRRLYGVRASYLPYPLREVPPISSSISLEPDRPMRITWVGRLFPEKDPLLAVAAVETLRRRREAVLDVYGDGPLRPELEQLARQRPWLLVHGARSWEEVQVLQARGHACLATSEADNVQVTVLEALSRGIPTVSTQVGDAPSYYLSSAIRHLCVAPRDPKAMADALVDLASSYDSYRSRFATNADILRGRHAEAGEALMRLLVEALPDAGRAGRTSPVR